MERNKPRNRTLYWFRSDPRQRPADRSVDRHRLDRRPHGIQIAVRRIGRSSGKAGRRGRSNHREHDDKATTIDSH